MLLVVSPAVAAEVEWTKETYDEAVQRAGEEDRYVLIDFYTTWCGPCKKLDRETYTNPEVLEFIDDMIPLKLDSENGEGIEISKQYRVAVWPTIMLVDSKGHEVDRIVGFVDADSLIQTLGEYRQRINTIPFYEAYLEDHPDDAETWKILGQKYADAARGPAAKAALTKYLELTPDLADEEKAEALYSIGEAYYLDKAYEKGIDVFTGILEIFPESEWADRSRTRMARCYYELGRIKESVAIYKEYADRHPDSASAANSFAWFCASRKVGLDAALPVALRAVELSKRDPGYLDTLAELYYARKEYDKAIAIGREALDKDPGDTYLENQLSKFRKAKDEADKAAS
jgi:tetratricopeptide (TPR) repeat protein